MRSIEVRKGSRFIITDGPSVLGVEHAVFPASQPLYPGTQVRFVIDHIEVADKDMILKIERDPFVSFGREHLIGQILGVMRIPSYEPLNLDKLLIWFIGECRSGNKNFVLEYSIKTRNGCGRFIDTFPDF